MRFYEFRITKNEEKKNGKHKQLFKIQDLHQFVSSHSILHIHFIVSSFRIYQLEIKIEE